MHGFLYDPIYKPTERKKAFQPQSTSCSPERAREDSAVPGHASPDYVSSLLRPLCLLQRPRRRDLSSRRPTVIGSKKMCPQDLGGTRLCIRWDVSVTRSEESFGLTDLFRNTCFFVCLFACLFVLLLLLGLKPHINRCAYKNLKTRTSVFTCAAPSTK